MVPNRVASTAELSPTIRLVHNASSTNGLASALPYQTVEKPWKSVA